MSSILGVELTWLTTENNIFDSTYMVQQISNAAKSRQYDGMFVTIPNAEIASAVMQVLRDYPSYPMVIFNVGRQSAKQQGLLSVMQDEIVAGQMIGNALIDKGARDFVCVSHSRKLQSMGDRCSGVLQAFVARGINMTSTAVNNKTVFIDPVNPDSPANYQAIMAHLNSHPQVDTIVALTTLAVNMTLEISQNKTNSVSGRVGGYWVGTFDLTDTVVQSVESGAIVAAISQTPYLQGALPVLELFLEISAKQRLAEDIIWTGPYLLDKSNIMTEYALDQSADLGEFAKQAKTAVVLNRDIPLEETRWNEALGGLVEAGKLFGWDTVSATSMVELERIQGELMAGNNQSTISDTSATNYGPYKGVQGVVVSLADKMQYDQLLNSTVIGSDIPIIGMGTVSNWTGLPRRAVFLGPSDDTIGSTFASQILSSGFSIPLCLIEDNGPWWQLSHCTQLHNSLELIYGIGKVGTLEDMMLSVPANATDLAFNGTNLQQSIFNNTGNSKNILSDVSPTVENNPILARFSPNSSLSFDSILCTSLPLYNVVDQLYPQLRSLRMGTFSAASLNPPNVNVSIMAGRPSLSKAAPDPNSLGIFVLGVSPKAVYSLAHDVEVTGLLNPQQYLQGFYSIVSMTTRMMFPNRNTVFNQFFSSGPMPMKYVCEAGQYYSSTRNISSELQTVRSPGALSVGTSFSALSMATDSKSMLCIDESGHVKVQSMCQRCAINTYTNQTDSQQWILMAVLIPIATASLLVALIFYCWQRRKKFINERKMNDDSWQLDLAKLLYSGIGGETDGTYGLPRMSSPGGANSIVLPAITVGGVSAFSALKRRSSAEFGPRLSNEPGVDSAESSLPSRSAGSRFGSDHVASTGPRSASSSNNTKSIQHSNSGSQFSLVMSRGSSAVGTWRSMPVYIKKIGSKKVVVNSDLRKEIFNMRELRHPKLVEFIGVCLTVPNICVVTELAPKGTLASVLANMDHKFTWLFKFSFMQDLCRGMEFLHMSKIGFHGRLTSMNCLISSRWELKIAGYGLSGLYKSQLEPVSQPSLLNEKQPKQKSSGRPWFSEAHHAPLEHDTSMPQQGIYDFSQEPLRRSKELRDLMEGGDMDHRSSSIGVGSIADEDTGVSSGAPLFSSMKPRNSSGSRYSSSTPNTGFSSASAISDGLEHSGFDDPFDCMPLMWAAPECLHLNKNGDYEVAGNQRGDLYSAGVIFNEILTRHLPYHDHIDFPNVIQHVKEEDLRPTLINPEESTYSAEDRENIEQMNQLIRLCLAKEPTTRPHFTAMLNRINDINPHKSSDFISSMAAMLEKYGNDMEEL
ncbi:hypothetical protein BGZ54_008906, partial [Gamsiella multidivaricata]